MDSSMISKIEKAMRYAQEPDRINFNQFKVNFTGDHDSHMVTYSDGKWTCDCGFFGARGVLQPRDDTRTRFDGDGNTGPGPADAGLVPGQLNTTDKRHPFGGGVFVVAGKAAPGNLQTLRL